MFRRLLLGFLVTGLAAITYAAAPETPVIRGTILGFNHQFPNRHWTPLRVDIENPGPERRVTLVVEPATRAQGQSINLSRPVWLPAHSRSTVLLTVFPDTSEIPSITKPGQEDTSHSTIVKPFIVKLTDGGLKVWSQYDVLGKLIADNAAVMLVADARLTSYRTPADVPSGWAHRAVSRVGIDPRDLPARAVDYDGINLLILGDLGTRELNTMQRQAILDWVHAGGTLVIPASANLPDDFQAILPVDFAASDKLATEPRLNRWAKPTIFEDGIVLRRMTLRDGTILAGDINSPLLVQRREGLGSVVTFALDSGDTAFQHWTGATNCTTEFINLALKTISPADRLLERAAATDAIVSSLAGIKVLGRAAILSYLAALVAGIIVLLYLFRCTRAPERGWPVVAVLAVAAGSVVIVVAGRWKGQPQPFLNEVTVVYVAADAQRAVAHTALGLYSPRAAAFDLTAPAETLRLRPRTGYGITPDPFNLHVEDTLHVAGLPVRASDMRAMFGQAILPDTKQPQARARLTETGLEVVVRNPTGQPLDDCFFKCNRFVAPIGDVPAGSTKTFRNLETSEAFTTRVVQDSGDELRSRIRRLLFPDPIYTLGKLRLPDSTSFRQRGPAVYGWTDKPLFPATIEQSVARRAVNLWDIETPVAFTGQQLTIPRGLMTLRLRNRDARTVERAEGRYSGTRGNMILAEFSLPAECPDLQITSAKVFVNYRGSAFRCRVAMRPPVGDDLKLTRQLELTGGPVYSVTNPGQWYAQRSFVVAVDVEPVGSDAAQVAAVNYWQIRELDMEIGGTVQ